MSGTERDRYSELLRAFISGRMDPPTFVREFFRAIQEHASPQRLATFEWLDRVFMVCEGYCEDLSLRDEFDSDEAMLLSTAKKTLLWIEGVVPSERR